VPSVVIVMRVRCAACDQGALIVGRLLFACLRWAHCAAERVWQSCSAACSVHRVGMKRDPELAQAGAITRHHWVDRLHWLHPTDDERHEIGVPGDHHEEPASAEASAQRSFVKLDKNKVRPPSCWH
jgi:hypothetical protein